MIAFFLTMPISRMMPMSATMPNSVRQIMSARSAPTPAVGRAEVEVLELLRALLELGHHLQHDVVLVQLGEHDRDLPLAEGIVERLVDHRRRDAEARRGVSVDDERRAQPAVLRIARDVA